MARASSSYHPKVGEPVAITPDGTVLGRDYVYADHVIVGSGSVLTIASGPGVAL